MATWEGKLSVYHVSGRGWECSMNLCVSVFVYAFMELMIRTHLCYYVLIVISLYFRN